MTVIAKKASLLFVPWIGMLLLTGCLPDPSKKAGPSSSLAAPGTAGGTVATTTPSNPQDIQSTASLLNGSVRAILAQPDGKTVFGGDFHPPNYIARLNSDGSMDAEFGQNIGLAFNASVHALALAGDGGILVGGEFSDFSGMFASRIVRLNSDGTLDNDFRINLGQGFNDKVSSLVIQGDGKIIVAGNFTEFNGTSAVRIARLNADGTFDSTYGVPADTTPPPVPTSWTMAPANGSTSNNAAPVIAGADAENTAVVSVWADNACSGAPLGTATVSNSAFSVSAFSLSGDGAKTFYFKIADTKGNATACAATGLSYTLDTTVPVAPTAWSMTPSSGSTSNNAAPVISGDAAENGAIVSIYPDNTCSGSALATGTVSNGAFSISAFTVSGNGTKTFYFQIADAAGNATACSTTGLSYTLDATAPAAPSSWVMSSPSSGSTSRDTTPAISGSVAENTAVVSVWTSSSCSGTARATGTVSSGAFAISAFTLSGDGAKTFYFKIADTTGNSTACATTGLSYTLDTTPPSAPSSWSMTSPSNGSTSGDTTPVISGHASENTAVVSVWTSSSCSNSARGTGTVSSGAFTISSFTLSGSGLKTFYYRIADTLGNSTSCAATGLSYTLN